MQIETTDPSGFHILGHPSCGEEINSRLVQESSAIGDYPDSLEKPGSSYLWFGADHHLNREEVQTLVSALQHWLKFGTLPEDLDE